MCICAVVWFVLVRVGVLCCTKFVQVLCKFTTFAQTNFDMATIKAFIRTQKDTETKIRFRLSDGGNRQLFFTSHLMVLPSLWDTRHECIKKRSYCPIGTRERIDNGVEELKDIIMRTYESNYSVINSSAMLQRLVEEAIHPQEDKAATLDEEFDDLILHKDISPTTIKGYVSLKHQLKRYEDFRRGHEPKFSLMLRTLDEQTIRGFLTFIRNGDTVKRGDNYLCCVFRRLKSLLNEMVSLGLIAQSPAKNITIKAEKYGTPYYITLEERNAIAETNLSFNKSLETQRDIFIFQCCLGCRVSDLMNLTEHNIVNGAIEYIPKKTKGERLDIVRVPLNDRALSLIEKYKGVDRQGRLFPFVSSQKYNVFIKRIFTACGITRTVLVYDSYTGREERKPINEIASSHLARRTFIGNLYKKVKDPNLVGSMSGHKEGSRAFARYRNIDDDIKKELVDLLE